MYKELLDYIKSYNNIIIYRHQRPDGDAVYSSFALATFLKSNFKDKNIQIYGNDGYDLLPYKNIVPEKEIKNSLAIILDTANTQRIDDGSYKLANKVIKIDHHPNIEEYGDLNIVDDKSSSTCQLVSEILFSQTFEEYKIYKEVCEYLYCGLLTDTLNFKTTNVSAKTFKIASILVEKGDLLPSELSNKVFNKTLEEFEKISALRNYLITKDKVGYLLLNEKDLNDLNLSMDEAKNQIAEFGSIKDLNIWAIFVFDKNTNKYNGSLRSKRDYVINGIAQNYNGGGHKNACGVKGLSLQQVNNLLDELINLSNNTEQKA